MSSSDPSSELLDLKLLPAWVKETATARDYSNFEGEEAEPRGRRGDFNRDRPRRTERPRGREQRGGDRDKRRPDRRRPEQGHGRAAPREREEPAQAPLPPITLRFVPHPPPLENVIAQIKSGTAAYSVYALARLFLEKPERYDVRLTTAPETPLFQIGEHGPVASDRRLLENIAFASTRDEIYQSEVVQTEPIKGNFTNVARDRASGTLLGPTNHHSYQTQLRNLYEQRYSRRMSFPDFQRQIEIVSDPAVVEQWKEQARSVTTYATKDEPPVTFQNLAEVERDFRQNHLPNLIRSTHELTVAGVPSRRLPDRALGRLIENAWSHETRSPSNMMQELAGALRQAGLNIFRHRRGMLFVSPIRMRSFKHELTSVSPSVGGILEAIGATPGIHRKELAEKLISTGGKAEEMERAKRTLATDLRWLISEGYVIEFNDGSLDLPRTKQPEAKPAEAATEAVAESPAEVSETPPAEMPVAEAEIAAEQPVAPAEEATAPEAPQD